MATLEVHDGSGRVEYATISRDGISLIGADPKCDVVVPDPQALPIHGRLRWRRNKLRVEAMPEVRSLLVNGRKMTKATLRQGDEVVIGGCRIFVLSLGDHAPDVEKTQVQDRPAISARLESGDWLKDLEVAPPSSETIVAERTPTLGPSPPRRERGRGRAPGPATLSGLLPVPAAPEEDRPPTSLARRAARVFIGSEQAPGQESIVRSPLILGLLGTLVVLAGLGAGLWEIITRRTADNAYARATEALSDGDFLNAMRQYDRFLELASDDPRASEARVRRALADVRRFLGGAEPALAEGLRAARGALRRVGEEPAFDDARAELADVVLEIARGLAGRTRRTAVPDDLAATEAAVALHERILGAPSVAAARRERAGLPAALAAATAAVRKAQTRQAALDAMDAALNAGSAAGIYDAHDGLIASYPDLAEDRAVVERMTRAGDLLRQAVYFDATERPAEVSARPEPVGPATSLVVRAPVSGPAYEGPEAVVFALVEGFAYGLSAADGAPLWHCSVGLDAPFSPRLVPGGEPPSALVVDAVHEELLRLDVRDGRLIWRQALGEPVADPPLVLGDRVYQPTPSGRLLQLDLDSGALKGTLDLGRPLSGTPVADELGRHLYVLAERSVLFVIARDPPGCVAVEYLGHDAGSIPCGPVRVGRYLVVPENHGLDEGRWRVFLLEDDGSRLRPLQRIPVAGWVWDPPATQGSVIWALGDRGGLTALAIGVETEPTPFRSIVGQQPDVQASGPAFARARTERELWLSAHGRVARYDLVPERGTLAPAWTVVDVGPASAPIQAVDRLAVFTHRAAGGAGMVLLGIDSTDGSVVWRTLLGRPWPVEPVAAGDGAGLATLGIDGRPLTIPRALLESGGFVEQTEPAPGAFRLPPNRVPRLVRGDLSVIVPKPDARRLLVVEGTMAPRPIDLPAPLAALPLFRGEELLIPAADGLVYLIDPRTGASRAAPYVPPYERDRPYRWLRPALLEGDGIALVDDLGRVRRLVVEQEGAGQRLAPRGEPLDLGSSPVADPAANGAALVLATADGQVRALSTRDLSPLGAWPLTTPPVLGPVRLGDAVLVADAAGSVLALGPDGRRLWSTELSDGPPTGPPAQLGAGYWFLDRGGNLQRRALADGVPDDPVDVGALPAGGPVVLGADLAVPLAPGTMALHAPGPPATATTDEEMPDVANR